LSCALIILVAVTVADELNLKEYKLLIDAKSKIFYSTTTESFGNRTERSRAMLLRLVQLDQSLAYI